MTLSNDIRLVAFLDILGFSSLVERAPPAVVIEKFDCIFRALLNSRSRDLTKRAMDLVGTPNAMRDVKPLLGQLEKIDRAFKVKQGRPQKTELDEVLRDLFPFRYMIVSDSILIYSDVLLNDSAAELVFREFVEFVRDFVADALLQSLYLRGAITIGEFYVDARNSIYFGKALLELMELEKAQKWIGCVLSESLGGLIANYFGKFIAPIPSEALPRLDYIHPLWGHTINKYDVPTDTGRAKRYIVNWYPRLISPNFSLEDNFFDHALTGKQDVDAKFRNTLAYMRWWDNKLRQLLKRS